MIHQGSATGAKKYEDDVITFEPTRVLIEYGKIEPNIVLPIFEEALSSDNSNLKNAAIFELLQYGENHPKQAISLLKSAASLSHPYSLRYEPTRILVELGKIDPASVVAAFELALESQSEEIQWLAVNELKDLATNHPDVFLPLLACALDSPYPQVQWSTVNILLNLLPHFPQHILFLLSEVLQPSAQKKSVTSMAIDKKLKSNPNTAPNFQRYKKIFVSNSADQQTAIIELISYADDYPEDCIPLLIDALESKVSVVRWVAMFILIQFSNKQPVLIGFYLNNYATREEEWKSEFKSKRILVKLAGQHFKKLLPLFESMLTNNMSDLQMLSMHEVLQAHERSPERFIKIMNQVFVKNQNKLHIIQHRVLVELAKTNPDNALAILQRALSQGNQLIAKAASKELEAIHHIMDAAKVKVCID